MTTSSRPRARRTSRRRDPVDLAKLYRGTPECEALVAQLAANDLNVLCGLPSGAVALVLAAAVRPVAPGPVLVITGTQEEAEAIVEETALLTGGDVPALFFPPWESLFLETSRPDEDIFHERVRVLRSLAFESAGAAGFVIAPVHAVLQPIPEHTDLVNSVFRLAVNDETSRDALAKRLEDCEFTLVPIVLHRGEYSVRGDIVDVYPYDCEHPIRVEFFGDTIDSIREYELETQRSIAEGEHEEREILLTPIRAMFQQPRTGTERSVLDLFSARDPVVLVEPGVVRDRVDRIAHNLLGDVDGPRLADAFFGRLEGRRRISSYSLAAAADEEGERRTLDFATVDRFAAADLKTTIERIEADLGSGSGVTVFCDSMAERRRIADILGDHSGELAERVDLEVGAMRRGFESRALARVVLSTGQLFNRRTVRRARKVPVETRVVHSFFDLQEGDLVVHISHGIGRYLGVTHMERDGVPQEFLTLEFRGGVKVHVPASKIDLVQKYVGKGTHTPPLDRVGGASWSKRKEGVEKAILDFASELLEVQAMRQEKPGLAYPADNEWQRQFEAAFPFEDTPDQRVATTAVKKDLETARPMDRLLCGDVGYGKTEIAMRAAFKIINAGKQAVILVPTTVLASQHCRTFRERMAEFPVRIESLSRFCSTKEARAITEATAAGAVDILIGTHRVLSKDVSFKDLGLVVIDEEQRFGVGHKEKLKRLRATVEVLTLTATPIPRTLHLSLLGIRDISSLSTPPEGRSPIQTEVIEFDRKRIREAVIRELNREGQVYFVHNRINDIGIIRHELQQIVPEAVIEFAHGRMTEHELEDIMMRFLAREIDLLVSTTIIETGIDIPNVNTIFINECDRYGLADLHQLRGRVGRSRHRAYCYLIMPQHRHVNPDARKRIESIREFSQLGAGFQIAMRDLEIRGAGNILGAEQSGHIAVVGYDLYCRLLEKAVNGLRGEPAQKAVDVEIDLNVEAYIPGDLMPDESTRLEIYRRVSKSQEIEALDELVAEIRDRWGALGGEVRNLIDVQRLRILAARHGVLSVRFDDETIIVGCSEPTRPLLDTCGLRVVILDPVHAALVVNPPGGRRRVELTDEIVFHAVLGWLEEGKMPLPLQRAKAVRARRLRDRESDEAKPEARANRKKTRAGESSRGKTRRDSAR